jgi:hypothetical protein
MEIKKTFYRGKQYEWKIFSPEELENLRDDEGKVIFPKEKK